MYTTLQAAQVLADARFALERFYGCQDEREQRVLWFALIGMLRAVGHVLDKVDAAADVGLRRRVDAWWPAAPQEPIFRNFIENDRNQFLKTYRPMPVHAVVLTDDGRMVLTDGGLPLLTSEPYVVGGPFGGRAAVTVADEAVAWWKRELAALTA